MSRTSYDIVALGELLIDFTPAGSSLQGGALYERNPGGAPANVLAAVSKLGLKTAFIGKVGEDDFGQFLRSVLLELKMDTQGLILTKEANTTLAFVHLDSQGDRSFTFYRDPGADRLLQWEEVDQGLLEAASVFHFGSVSMTHEPSRTATLKAARACRDMGRLVSYDPNLRPLLWEDLEEARAVMLEGMQYADIVKISEEELAFLTGMEALDQGTEQLFRAFRSALILVTRGPAGCYYRRGDETGHRPGYTVHAVDTTGAGDAFLGALLYQLCIRRKPVKELAAAELMECIDFANAAGALTTTRKGAIPALPDLNQIETLRGQG